jgi:hypothetical protein
MEEVRRATVPHPGGEVIRSPLRQLADDFRDRASNSFKESMSPRQFDMADARSETWGRAAHQLMNVVLQLEDAFRDLVREAEKEGSSQYQMGCRIAAGMLGMEEGYDPRTREARQRARDAELEE